MAKSTPEKLLKFLISKNIAESLDEEKRKEIAEDVVIGMRIDEKTREEWLRVNKTAMEIIKDCEDNYSNKADLYDGQCKVIYPLLAPSIVQLASRTVGHVVRNNRTVECAILGPDKLVPDPDSLKEAQQTAEQIVQQAKSGQIQPQQAQQMVQQVQQSVKHIWEKQSTAKKVSDFLNYELLIENDQWLSDEHKLNTIVASWGVGFKQVYYDYITNENCSELIHPEDVIINHNVSCLDKAPRITTRHWFTKNEVMEKINAGYFLDIDLGLLQVQSDTDEKNRNDSEEKQPIYEFVCQTCYIDLDDDGYLEPYKCYVHVPAKLLFCVVPAFDQEDIHINEKTGNVYKIERRLDIVDRHLIDSPDGNYWSFGLNYLLLHLNKSITSILRQLVDAGTLSNAAAVSGFVTKAFKTKERELKLKLGQFHVLDCNPAVNPQDQIINMPFREPSQVLLGLLQLLIETGKNSGFISDILTGDVEMQNVPATTMMAMVEQGTRAFKPIISKLYISLKKEFEMLFRLHAKHLDKPKYAKFQGSISVVDKNDFDLETMEVSPVADPTLSSEAQGFARCRALAEAIQVFQGVINPQEAALRYFTDMQFDNPEKLIQQQQQGPNPDILEIQLKQQIAQQKNQIDQMALQLEGQKLQNKQLETQLKAHTISIKATESQAKIAKMHADAHKEIEGIKIQKQQADTDAESIKVDKEKVDVMREQAQNQHTENMKDTGNSND